MSVAGAITIGSTLLDIGTSLFGSHKANQKQKEANKKMRQSFNNRISDLDSWYNKEYHQDYLNSKRGKHLANRYREKMNEMLDKNEQNAVESGATAEAEVAAKGEAQEKYSGFLSNISSQAEKRKRNVRRRYEQQKNNLLNQKANFNYKLGSQKAQNYQKMAGNVSNALSGVTKTAAEGGFDDWFNGNDN